MRITNHIVLLLALATVIPFAGCKREQPETFPFETPVPETYDFPFVDFSGQSARLDQLSEMMAYIETANEQGVQLDLAVLNDMFSNENDDANGNFTFSSSKQIKDKVFEPDLPLFASYFERIVTASKSIDTAKNGTAGVLYNTEGTSSRLFDENGFELAELIEKGLMGALCYYQATAVYLGDEKMNVDNEEVVEGEGTAMAHHWDEAYGYLGVTTEFPNDLENVAYWGKYCVRHDASIGSVEALSGAFRRGRAGILWQRYDERDSAIVAVREAWENVAAVSALHYINAALLSMTDDYTRNHVLSEAYGFIKCLFYNPERRITQAQIDQVLALIGDNLYETSAADLQEARDLLAGYYGWENQKTNL
jgi:hypothetical protein